MRLLLRAVVVIALLAVLALVLLFVFVDRAAKTAIEKGGTYALGVPTTLGEADIGLVSGRFALGDLVVANPAGFESPHFMRLGRGELELSLSSLTSDLVEVPSLVLDGLSLSLERKDGKANYDEILKHLEKAVGSDGKKAPPADEGSAKKFVIREIVLNNVRAEVQLLPVGGSLTKTTVTIPTIRLKNVGNDGQSMSELFAAILDAVLRAVVDVGGDLLPKDLLNDLSKKLPDLGKQALELTEKLGGSLGELGKGVGEKAGEVLDEAARSIDGLLKKKK
jgi:hypothetical protein